MQDLSTQWDAYIIMVTAIGPQRQDTNVTVSGKTGLIAHLKLSIEKRRF